MVGLFGHILFLQLAQVGGGCFCLIVRCFLVKNGDVNLGFVIGSPTQSANNQHLNGIAPKHARRNQYNG